MEKLKTILNWLFVKNGFLKMVLSFVIALVLAWLSEQNSIDYLWTISLFFFGYTGLFIVIGLAYAWVINPYRDWKKRK